MNLDDLTIGEANLPIWSKKMSDLELAEIIENHSKWVNGDGGARADLRGADLRGSDLRGANLREADLRGADLTGTRTKVLRCGMLEAIIQPEIISIGCQRHDTAKWREFNDEEIGKMHGEAINWWRENKSIVMSIAESIDAS